MLFLSILKFRLINKTDCRKWICFHEVAFVKIILESWNEKQDFFKEFLK